MLSPSIKLEKSGRKARVSPPVNWNSRQFVSLGEKLLRPGDHDQPGGDGGGEGVDGGDGVGVGVWGGKVMIS